MRSKNLETDKVTEGVVCPRCGFKNLSGAKFCSSCGLSFKPTLKGRFDGSVALLFAGSIYLLFGIAFNQLMQEIPYFWIPAVVSGLLGLYAAYQLNKGQGNKATFAVALTSIIIGLVVTVLLFLVGIIPIANGNSFLGLTGAPWIIFALAAFWLYRDKSHSTALTT